VWPELLEAYRKAGIRHISCFVGGLDLVVYTEYETEIYEKRKDSLRQNPVEIRWQALMKTLRDPKWPGLELQEVFYMSPVAKEKMS
jgi:L-rhamnose mutarotase